METAGRGEKRSAQKPLRWKFKAGDGHGTRFFAWGPDEI